MKIKSLVTDVYVTAGKEYEVIEEFSEMNDWYEVTITSDTGEVVWISSDEFEVVSK